MDLETTGGGKPPERNSTRTWLAIGLAATIAWSVFLATAGPRGGGDGLPPDLGPPIPPARADFRWTLLDLDGSPVNFGRFRGRPIVLNLWATWCGPCLREMPSIARLAENPRLKDKGVAFLCVSVDDPAETLRRYVAGGLDLRLMSSVTDASGLPKEGRDLVVVARDVNGAFHFRIFDADGRAAVDTDEKRLLPGQAKRLDALREQLKGWGPPRELTWTEKDQVITAVTSIVGHTLAGKPWKMTILRATSIPPVFATDGIPATFLIGPDGRIAASQVGSAKWDDPSVVDFLEKLARTDAVRP